MTPRQGRRSDREDPSERGGKPGWKGQVAALALLLLVATLAMAAAGIDPMASWRHWRELEVWRGRLTEIQERITAGASIDSRLAARLEAETARPRLVAGETSQARAHAFQQLVDDIGRRHGFEMMRSTRPTIAVSAGVERLELRRQGRIAAGALGGFIQAIETARPLLTIREISIRREMTGEEIDVQEIEENEIILHIDLTLEAHGLMSADPTRTMPEGRS